MRYVASILILTYDMEIIIFIIACGANQFPQVKPNENVFIEIDAHCTYWNDYHFGLCDGGNHHQNIWVFYFSIRKSNWIFF